MRGLTDHLTFTDSAAGVTAATSAGQSFVFGPNANTVLTGGGSNEAFVFNAGFGHASITDFAPSAQAPATHDTIAFSAGTFADFADLMQHATQSGTSTIIADTHGDSLTLQHVALAHLTAGDFILS